MIFLHHAVSPANSLSRRAFAAALQGLISGVLVLSAFAAPVTGQTSTSATWSVSVVLPPRVIAGQPATLAVLGADGRLASGVTVELGKDQRVKTDSTGRALFSAPSEGGVMLAKASGASAAALVDPAAPARTQQGVAITSVISQSDRFSICGVEFRGDADANRVRINGDRALVLAASPECLVVLPGPKTKPGPAKISIDTAEAQWTAATTVVSLEFEPPDPPLVPEKKSRLVVRAQGCEKPLAIIVENESPGVLRFLRGDSQQLRTSGGVQNSASIEVRAIRSGDFSFRGLLIPLPDPDTARRYLVAAAPLAGKDFQRSVKNLAERLAHHPHDVSKIRRDLDRILVVTIVGDFRTLLEAARAAL